MLMNSRLWAFVAMPFDTKRAPNGSEADVDRIHKRLIKPAVGTAGVEGQCGSRGSHLRPRGCWPTRFVNSQGREMAAALPLARPIEGIPPP